MHDFDMEGSPATRSMPSQSHIAAAGEYLTFSLGGEEYGIDILRVQEIRSYEQPTRIAGGAHFLKGVVNLRGVIVPIVDLRLKLGCESAQYDSSTVVIVLNLAGKVLGAVADSVQDVVRLGKDEIKPAPEMNAVIDDRVITGLGKVTRAGQEKMLILVDIERLLGDVLV